MSKNKYGIAKFDVPEHLIYSQFSEIKDVPPAKVKVNYNTFKKTFTLKFLKTSHILIKRNGLKSAGTFEITISYLSIYTAARERSGLIAFIFG